MNLFLQQIRAQPSQISGVLPALSHRKPQDMFTQLNPPIPLTVTDRGDGFAIGVIDYGQEHNPIWVTVITATGEIWCAPNPSVRGVVNWTMGRPRPATDSAH